MALAWPGGHRTGQLRNGEPTEREKDGTDLSVEERGDPSLVVVDGFADCGEGQP